MSSSGLVDVGRSELLGGARENPAVTAWSSCLVAKRCQFFLLWALSKGDRDNFSDSEIAQMNTAAKAIIEAYRRLGSPPRHRSNS